MFAMINKISGFFFYFRKQYLYNKVYLYDIVLN